ncbi:receptor-like protein EIX2 [Zingiber officinale]|uniref:Uncharacterized protein n=1 Tax=Zingiber officinale TaxID=94328 RepID=A0A8J5FV39_ZINOF|nr:receptor-like protein EIX2 [Zingiber officinale]KAG6491360.1 hypothetical protein ZIOFF_052700 [Zingiber officinale]
MPTILLHLILWLLTARNLDACLGSERQALLNFKAGLNDPSDRLSSWKGKDCCRWKGVECNNGTSGVLKLKLRNPCDYYMDPNYYTCSLSGELRPSLVSLSELAYLDLSINDFGGIRIPTFIGSLKKLKYLNLSLAGFAGEVPPNLGNLSRLRYLDLSNTFSLVSGNLWWLTRLPFLKYLDFSTVNLTAASDWLDVVNMMSPSLSVLHLSSCSLSSIPTSFSIVNFTSLTTLNLLDNSFNSTLPNWLWKLNSLTYLDLGASMFHGPLPYALGNLTSLNVLRLGQNNLEGNIPGSIRNLCRLTCLDLSQNNFTGNITDPLPHCIWNDIKELSLGDNKFYGNLSNWLKHMTSLTFLDLGKNQLDGPIPTGLGKLSELTYLDLSYNSFAGVITEVHFHNLTKLSLLILSLNPLTVLLNQSWIPPFQLQIIGFRDCRLGPRFPPWLRWQTHIMTLDLSNTSIADRVPDWFWNITSSRLSVLDMSNNQLSGVLPSNMEFMAQLSVFELSSNQLEGSIPSLPNSLTTLDVSKNSFSGPLPSNFMTPNLYALLISQNQINGSIPPSVCQLQSLSLLDMSNNYLTGELPNCWMEYSQLSLIDLSDNNLSGEIPGSVANLSRLVSLNLDNNSFGGELPSSMQQCTRLTFLDLGQNKFSGIIPTWIGESLLNLVVLQLRSNMFFSDIPPQLAWLHGLQVLDLAGNNLSGSIPQSFGNFSAMASRSPTKLPNFQYWTFGLYGDYYYNERLHVMMKGQDEEYTKILSFLKIIDLSDNYLTGQIPQEIGQLVALKNLNLSRNLLSGKIPEMVSRIPELESLDLSFNELSGSIPRGISTVTFLSHLNLSYNNLSGRIPLGNQLQTLNDPSIYIGNANLCGPPLTNSCSSSEPVPREDLRHEDNAERKWLYLSMSLGFITGLWGLFIALLLNSSWRRSYFLVLDNLFNQLYVASAIFMARLSRKHADSRRNHRYRGGM